MIVGEQYIGHAAKNVFHVAAHIAVMWYKQDIKLIKQIWLEIGLLNIAHEALYLLWNIEPRLKCVPLNFSYIASS